MNTPRSFWGGMALICGIGLGSFFYAKSKINERRQKQFRPVGKGVDNILNGESNGEDFNSANFRPGFPNSDPELVRKRKSQYEGTGTSYQTRKPGDRFS